MEPSQHTSREIISTFPETENLRTETLVYSAFRPTPLNLYSCQKGLVNALTTSQELIYNPVVSQDGKWLIFTSEETGNPALYIKSLQEDAKPQRLLTGSCMQDAAALHEERLFFVGTRDGVADIFSIDFNPHVQTDIAKAVNLTRGQGSSFHPSVSPDGQWIAFCNNSHDASPPYFGPQPPDNYKAGNIYLMKADGTGMTRLTVNGDWDGSPTWSPDGSKIYYYSMREGKPRLYQVDPRTLQNELVSRLIDRAILSPKISPQGRLAFVEQRGERTVIASVNLQGSDLDYRLESDESKDYFAPAYHPDGSLMAHAREEALQPSFGGERPPSAKKPMGKGPFLFHKQEVELENGKKILLVAVRGYFPVKHPTENFFIAYEDFGKVCKIDLEGNVKPLFQVPEKRMGYGLSFSLDGRWFATAIGRAFGPANSVGHIYKISADGSLAVDLTPDSECNNSFPRVGSDRIVFTSTRSGNKNIFAMKHDGSDVQQLTFTNGIDAMPAISKKGNKIVFTSQRGTENYNLYILKKNKTTDKWEEIRLTYSKDSHAHPTFSPDGKKIAFSSGRGGYNNETPLDPISNFQPYGDIYVMTLKDRKIERLTANNWEDSLPQWS